jgi:rod shape-determining protein MreC
VDLLAGPIQIVSLPLKEIKKMLFYHRIYNEYVRLRSENAVLKTRLVVMEELIVENLRLEKLLTFKSRLVQSSVAARVIGRNPSVWNAAMIIDKGEHDGIRLGMPVVSDLGVVGKIAEVSKEKSKVVLLTDPQFSVAGLIQRPRESGLVTGTLQGVLRMRYINEDAEIQTGDKVITSKLSTSFPEGLLIGEVIQVESNTRSPSVECVIQPAVPLSQLEEVLVILTEGAPGA